jgi:hypothetical protein
MSGSLKAELTKKEVQEELYKRGFSVSRPATLKDQVDEEHAQAIALFTPLQTQQSVVVPQNANTSGEKSDVQDNTFTNAPTNTTKLEDIHMAHENVEPTNGNTDPVSSLLKSLTPEQQDNLAKALEQKKAPQAMQAAPHHEWKQIDFVRSIDMRLAGKGIRANAVPILQVATGVALGVGITAGVYYGAKYLFFSPVA